MSDDQQLKPIDPLTLDPNRTRTIGNYVIGIFTGYHIGKTLGKGTFGKVKAATHCQLAKKHPSIIQLYEIIQTPKQLFLIMQYMQGGQLFDYIVKSKKIQQVQACKIFQQIISGIEYIHKLNIVHRDLKPQNLLIDYDKTIRIVDFGLSNTYRKDQRLKTACGSPCYAAPEMIEGKNRYEAIMVDIWSCGVILYAMLCGCLPFEDPQTSKLYQKILAGEYKVPKFLSPDAKDILSNILNTDPTKRYTIQQIRKHKWWSLSTSTSNFSNGIIVGYHRIPVDEKLLKKTVKLGFQFQFSKKCIQANRHNDCTTTYYLLLKKYVRNGGISKTYLGSENFDKTLIQPVKRVFNTAKEIIDSNMRPFSPKASINQRNINSQPGITRKNYSLSNYHSLSKKRDSLMLKKQSQSLQSSARRGQFTPGSKLASHLYKKQRTISYNTRKPSNTSNTIQPTHPIHTSSNPKQQLSQTKYDTLNITSSNAKRDDPLNKKYRQIYGTSLVSRSKDTKDRSNSRKKSIKNQLSDIYQKVYMNQTISPYQNGRRKLKSQRIGIDKGFGDNFVTIDKLEINNKKNNSINQNYQQPYMNRRVYH